MDSKISVIIPVYNVETYLPECLDAICAQAFKDFEVICIDDSSTDSSPMILDEYAAKDPRFKIYRREHSNAGACRNFGMTKAAGDYLIFLDSDDVFSPWMFESLYDKAIESAADIVACSAIWFKDGGELPIFSKNDHILWQDCTPDIDWERRPLDVGSMPWNKIIRRTFIEDNHLRFLEQSSTNDFTFMSLALALSKRTLYTSEPLVGYRQRRGSIQRAKSPKNYFRAEEAFIQGLINRVYWRRFSAKAQICMFKSLFYITLWELSTLSTYVGYREFYRQIKVHYGNFVALSDGVDLLAYSPTRYRDIIEGHRKERARAFLEGVLSPILVGWSRQERGVRLALSLRLRRLLNIVFESARLPWNRPQ